ncbi:speriolin-like protein isoform X1 [Ambystoma mexicanum]|uniref:speriolin-like protein isoform X1 n=1 Tax=Ambystoma mexicanum TaxID=8296 RepID=UPI0037E6F95C
MDMLNSHDVESLQCQNKRLVKENTELRKLVSLQQENVELRTVLSRASRCNDSSPSPKRSCSPRHAQSATKECAASSSQEEMKEAPKHCDSQQIHKMGRIVGEIAFQLDRRILAYIFQDRIRLYGITVSNIPQKIKEATSCRNTGKVDEEQKSNLKLRYNCIMDKLGQFGYDPCVHPGFSEYIVNLFGILKERPQPGSEELKQLMDPENLKKMATTTVPENDLKDVLILLKCLHQLSKEDGKPVFVW